MESAFGARRVAQLAAQAAKYHRRCLQESLNRRKEVILEKIVETYMSYPTGHYECVVQIYCPPSPVVMEWVLDWFEQQGVPRSYVEPPTDFRVDDRFLVFNIYVDYVDAE